MNRLLRFLVNRLEAETFGSNVTTFWSPKSYMELVTSKCGLAKAFGLVYLDQCEGLQVHD